MSIEVVGYYLKVSVGVKTLAKSFPAFLLPSPSKKKVQNWGSLVMVTTGRQALLTQQKDSCEPVMLLPCLSVENLFVLYRHITT